MFITKYSDFLKESISQDIIYGPITALAYFKPEFFNFLSEPGNKYNLTTREFWQGFILTLKQTSEVVIEKDVLINLKTISIESDWNKIKKSVEFAEMLNKQYNVKQIVCFDKYIKINNDTFKSKNKEISITDVYDILGFTIKKIHRHDGFTQLLKYIVDLLNEHLNDDLKVLFNRLIFQKEITYKTITENISTGLGIRIDILPKLYYNTIKDFINDVFVTNNSFKINTQELVNSINQKKKELLINLTLQDLSKNMSIDCSELIKKHEGSSDVEYLTFEKGKIVKISSKNNIQVNIFQKEYKLNENLDLIIVLKSIEYKIEILFETGYIPTDIKVSYKINKL